MTYAISDCRISKECEVNLLRLGIKLIRLPAFSLISDAVASHTDLLLLPLGDEIISHAAYCEEAEEVFGLISRLFPKHRLSFIDVQVGKSYPNDCALNVLRMGKYLFCNIKSLPEHVRERAEALDLEIVHVNQGYPACTVMKLSDSAAITADRGMAEKMQNLGIKVTLIDDGGILLPPYRYGFIGGASGVYDGRLFITGDISKHPSYEKIIDAVTAEGLTLIPLDGGMPLDVGGILFISQDVDNNDKDGN